MKIDPSFKPESHYRDSRVAGEYDATRFRSLSGRAFDFFEKRALRGALRRLGNPRRVLDAACGTGRITRFLLDQGLRVIGADISLEMIRVAEGKARGDKNAAGFIQTDLSRLAVKNGAFDAVVCVRLFGHIPREKRVAILKRLAAAGKGPVILGMSASNPFLRLRRKIKTLLGQGLVSYALDRRELEEELREAGLKLKRKRQVLPFISEAVVLTLEKI